MRKRNLYIAAIFVAALFALGIAERAFERIANSQGKETVMAPKFEVDPMWPKPLPNHWLIGMAIGVGVGRPRSRLDRASRQHALAERSRRRPESADWLLLFQSATRP